MLVSFFIPSYISVSGDPLDGEGTFEGFEFCADVGEGNGNLLTGARLEGSDPHDCCLVVGEDPHVTFPPSLLQCFRACSAACWMPYSSASYTSIWCPWGRSFPLRVGHWADIFRHLPYF